MFKNYQHALALYQSGNLQEALKQANALSGKADALEGNVQALIGNICYRLGERRQAANAFIKAAHHLPANSAGFLKLAVSFYIAEGCVGDVIASGPQAVRQNPDDSEFAFSVAQQFFGNGLRGDLAPILQYLDLSNNRHAALLINYFRLKGEMEALSAKLAAMLVDNPDNSFLKTARYAVAREICDIDVIAEHEHLMLDPDTPVARELLCHDSAFARLLWSENEAINSLPDVDSARSAATPFAARRPFGAAGGKIRIGYLSNDFCEHAVMTLFLEAMAAHDRERFDITLFCYTEPVAAKVQDAWPETVKSVIVPLVDLTDEGAAKLISQHHIDILVDLKGHTIGLRAGIVNCSDAPVKVTYLGFPGSVGGLDLDYAITDPIVTPDSSKPFYQEKLCRLPETYQANNSRNRARPGPMSRSDVGLPNDKFVFASFNAAQKITPKTLSLWAEILMSVPGSVIWILCRSQIARRNITAAFERHGVANERVIFAEGAIYADHISRIALADLGLDTFPYNGHTTTSDMLWAGLPVLTIHGQTFASRVSASLLGAVGMGPLVCIDPAAFVAEACRLARQPEALATIRKQLATNLFSFPLFDTERFVRHLEKAYQLMAERARAGLLPDHIDVPALPPRAAPFMI